MNNFLKVLILHIICTHIKYNVQFNFYFIKVYYFYKYKLNNFSVTLNSFVSVLVKRIAKKKWILVQSIWYVLLK